MRGFWIYAVVSSLVLASAAAARAGEERKVFEWKLNGAYNRAAAERSTEDETGDEDDSPTLARLRAGVAVMPWDSFRSEAAYEMNWFWVENIASTGYADPQRVTPLRIDDIHREVSSGEDRLVTQNLDRLSIRSRFGNGTVLTLGRQAVSHGSGRFFNPTDIFAPVSPHSTYSEYKNGVDALRVDIPVGELGRFELWAVAHEDGADKSYYLARGQALLPGVSISAYGGATLGEATGALDLSGPLYGAEWHLEGVMRFDEPPSRNLRSAGGLQYRFPFKVNTLAEIHFNGVGRSDPDEYPLVTETREWRNGEIFLQGRWYTVVSADFEPLPLLTAGISWTHNLEDGSALIQPTLTWAAMELVTVRVGASKGYGEAPAQDTGVPTNRIPPVPRSEFGSYSEMIYGEVSFNF